MALIDVSELLSDPDFSDQVTLIRRASTISATGRNVLVETPATVTMVVQDVDAESMTKLPEGARLTGGITVFSNVPLSAEAPSGYSDIIVHGGRRYSVLVIVEDFTNHGVGFMKAVCTLEAINA